jgi:hypothetical protein
VVGISITARDRRSVEGMVTRVRCQELFMTKDLERERRQTSWDQRRGVRVGRCELLARIRSGDDADGRQIAPGY